MLYIYCVNKTLVAIRTELSKKIVALHRKIKGKQKM